MPIIFTRGGLSARGAGAFALIPTPTPTPPTPGPPPPPPPPGPPGPVTQLVVFTSSGTWTAPSGVTSISSINISGGRFQEVPGQFLYTTNIFAFAHFVSTANNRNDPPYTFNTAGGYADSILAQFNSGGTGERTVNFTQIVNYYNPSTTLTSTFFQFPTYTVRGIASRASGPWDNRTNTPLDFNTTQWYIGVDVYYPPTSQDGTPSSAFGFTVQGGTQNNPTPDGFFGSISVTPGQTYQIIVGSPSGGPTGNPPNATPAQVNFQFTQG
jgi:hypothetical protein